MSMDKMILYELIMHTLETYWEEMEETVCFLMRTIIFKDPKRYCEMRDLIPVLRDFLHKELLLTLHPNAYEIPLLGICLKPHRNYVVSRTIGALRIAVHRMEERVKDYEPEDEQLLTMQRTLNSYLGLFLYIKHLKFLRGLLENSPLQKYFCFKTEYSKAVIRKKYKPQKATMQSISDIDIPELKYTETFALNINYALV